MLVHALLCCFVKLQVAVGIEVRKIEKISSATDFNIKTGYSSIPADTTEMSI
jgi:hypothetical protein